MSQFFNLPPKFTGDVKIYLPTGGSTTNGYQVWDKPKGATIVNMFVIGGGAGGGGGCTRTTNADGGGGGGGAGGGRANYICPAILLPDRLYIQAGGGGVGGAPAASAGAGGGGINSYILASANGILLPNLILYSGVNVPGGGGGGTTTGAGAAGSVPTISLIQSWWNSFGAWSTTVGIVGQIGGLHTGQNGSGISAQGMISLGGAAGGAGSTGTNFAGGSASLSTLMEVGSQAYIPITSGNGEGKGGLSDGVTVNGGPGLMRLTPFLNTAGGGGGSNNSGIGGQGGSGGYGCGGGGGGAGATGGFGGNGGSGVVIIACC